MEKRYKSKINFKAKFPGSSEESLDLLQKMLTKNRAYEINKGEEEKDEIKIDTTTLENIRKENR